MLRALPDDTNVWWRARSLDGAVDADVIHQHRHARRRLCRGTAAECGGEAAAYRDVEEDEEAVISRVRPRVASTWLDVMVK